jgi:hypothetical protein
MTLKEKIIYDSLTVSRTHVNVYKVYAAAVRSSGVCKRQLSRGHSSAFCSCCGFIYKLRRLTAETNSAL